jgi:hypothetical protein
MSIDMAVNIALRLHRSDLINRPLTVCFNSVIAWLEAGRIVPWDTHLPHARFIQRTSALLALPASAGITVRRVCGRYSSTQEIIRVFRQSYIGGLSGYLAVYRDGVHVQPGTKNTGSTAGMGAGIYGK